jgi:hypothetical protein
MVFNMRQHLPIKHAISCLAFIIFLLPSLTAHAKGSNLVFFDFDSHVLSKDSKEQIADIMTTNQRPDDVLIRVIGHADLSGANNYNHALSRKRARAVKNEIVLQGIPRENIDIVGMGEYRPIILTENGVRELRNRRAEIQISDASASSQDNIQPKESANKTEETEKRNHWPGLIPFLILFLAF